jgi:hypothetical protein
MNNVEGRIQKEVADSYFTATFMYFAGETERATQYADIPT